jgi:YidC/Oxa1 family membrane protein insertase
MSKLFLESSEKVPAVCEVAAAAVWEPTWWPSDQVILLLNFVQETTGTPLAVTIIMTTISMRFFMFPLFVKAQKNTSRMAHLTPELNLLKAKVDAKGKGISQEDQLKYANQMKALFAKYKVNPAMGLMIPLVQMPIFM